MRDIITLQEAIRWSTRQLVGRGLKTPRQDAEILVRKATGKDLAFVLAHPERELTIEQWHRLQQWVTRRKEHYPIQYLVGTQEFFGRLFQVDPSVLIPRPETELIVETCLELLRRVDKDPIHAVDIGTGSGCIALTLASEEPRLYVTAIDISDSALEVARKNARSLGCSERIEFLQGDVLAPLERSGRTFDLVVSNPPYVGDRSAEVEYSVRTYEPRQAVFAGPTGLEIYSRIFRSGRLLLEYSGWLVLEVGYGIAERVAELATAEGWRLVEIREDLAGIPRCAVFRCLS